MKTKIVFFLSLLCAAAHGAALNGRADVQRPVAPSSSIGSLKWRLPAKYARIEGERLVVDIPESAYPADAVAVAEIPKEVFDGADGFSFSVNVVANGIAKPSKPYLGLKCQIYSRGNPPYGERYSNGDADGLQGDFGETICSWVNFPDLRPDVVALNLGLQGTSGRAVFDLSSLRGGGTDGPFCRVKGIFRRVNDGKRVAYPERVSKDSRRRGVMLPGRAPTEDDFKTLSDWGVTLVRYQMVGAPRAKNGGPEDIDDFNRWLDVKLDVLEKTVLPLARKYGMKVTVDLHDAPGGRDNVRGMKILLGGKFTDAFVDSWRRIAKRFRGNEDVIYGYDLVNEPNQSRIAPVDYWTIQRMAAEAIREIDPETTIIIESNGWDVPSTFSYLSPLDLDNVIYQVHLYEPMDFTHQGIHDRPIGAAWPDEDKKRDRDFIRRTLAPVRDFERRHGAKIYVGEFSAATWARGAENYISDCIAVFEEYGWDWTYHAFREYQGWSVEHEATGPKDIRPSADNPRKRVLLEALGKKVVPFKDAAKIKSWDAWNDHKGVQPKKERRSVTWEKLQKLDCGLEPAGTLATRHASEIKSSKWSIGCETMDRDYADWNQFRQYVGMIGAKHGRLFSGWAKTEQEKGKYDFTWLDPQVREMAAMGVKPWICLSYGNPVYGSDFRLGMRVKQVTDSPEAFDAWIRFVKACVERYKDVVNEWEVWNEPFGQGPEYAEMFYRTAKAIRSVQSCSRIFCTAVNMKDDYVCVLEKLKKENALDLGSYFIYHPYVPVPEYHYVSLVKPLRELVKSYSPDFEVMQGEVGCPAQLEFEHAMHSIEWTEYSQAKWNLRQTVGDAARDIPCNVFTMIDLQYTFMLQSFGMLRSNTLKEVVYRRPSFYAMQHVFSYFDDDVRAVGVEEPDCGGRRVTVAKFTRNSTPVYVMWFSWKRPTDALAYEGASFSFVGEAPENPVWVDLLTGKVAKIPPSCISAKNGVVKVANLPLWDSPVMLASDAQVPRATDVSKK